MRDVSFFATDVTPEVAETERMDAGRTAPGATVGILADVLITVGFGNSTGLAGFSLIVLGLVALGAGAAGLGWDPCLRKFNLGGRGSPSFCCVSSAILQLLTRFNKNISVRVDSQEKSAITLP